MIRWLIILLISLCLFGCRKPSDAKSQDILILSIGGLGQSQMADIENWVSEIYPSIGIQTFSNWDGYKTDIPEYLSRCQYKSVILIGHSFGCSDIIDAANSLPDVNLVILVDPVAYNWGNLTEPATIQKTLVFRRTYTLGPPRADINGPNPIDVVKISGGHNDIPHNIDIFPIMQSYINQAIN